MKKKYDNFGKQCKELATSYGLKKLNWEEFFNLWREFLEEWDRNVDKTKKLIKIEMKEKRALEKKKQKKKPKLAKKSKRREPKSRKVHVSKRKKRKTAKGKRRVALHHEEPDSEEEKELAELSRLQAERPEVLDARLKKVFRTMDADNSGLLDLDEFKVAARKFDLNEEEDIKSCFNRVDIDGSGTLDFDEFRMAIKIALTDKHLMAGINRKMRKTLRSGALLRVHFEDENPESVTVKVNQEGALMYEEKGSGTIQVSMKDVTRIEADADSQVFKNKFNKDSKKTTCFSVYYKVDSQLESLDFSTKSLKERDAWVTALRKLNTFYKT